MIPKHIHQTWKNESVPEQFRPYVDSWQKHHPGWQYTLWTDEMNTDFIANHYPGFLRLYNAYPQPIQRVDAVRYFILKTYGGIFVDLDFECLKETSPLLSEGSFIAGLEPREHAIWHHKDYIISNAFMAAAPACPFLDDVCNRLLTNDYFRFRREKGFNAILDCAGPFMLSRVYNLYKAKEDVKIVGHELLYPLVKDPLTGRIRKEDINNIAVTGNAYAIHHYWGSWWQQY